MLLHFDCKLQSFVFLFGITSFLAVNPIEGVSVRYVDSNLPSENQDYIYEAIGLLQLTLEEINSMDAALSKFVSQFQNNHNFQIWELGGGCNVLILPNETSYIKLVEITTGIEVNLFSTNLNPSTTESSTSSTTSTTNPDTSISTPYSTTSNPYSTTSTTTSTTPSTTTSTTPSTTTSTTPSTTETTSSTTWPTTTSGPIPFSVKEINSSVPNSAYVYNAVGTLQYYLGQTNSVPLALPVFLQAYQRIESTYIWKISSECNVLILANNAVYITLLEERTNTEINIFG